MYLISLQDLLEMLEYYIQTLPQELLITLFFHIVGFGASNTTVQIYVTYKSGNSGYTIANNESYTLCKI